MMQPLVEFDTFVTITSKKADLLRWKVYKYKSDQQNRFRKGKGQQRIVVD